MNLSRALFVLLVTVTTITCQAQLFGKSPYLKAPNEDFHDDDLQASKINNQANNQEFSLLTLNQSTSSSIVESVPNNFYSDSSAASKFRVNVSNVCERTHMHVTLKINKPFFGLIHAKDRRRKPSCFVEGNGEQAYTLDLSYTLVASDPGYCGVVSHHLSGPTGSINNNNNNQKSETKQTTLSVVLVVRLHKTIEFSDDRYFLLSCANRCTKPDCSQESKPPSKEHANLSTSESILSPLSQKSNNSSNISNPANWSTEKCDLMLDMKFQWLLKLCWILSFLLLFMFCVTMYLCFSLGGRKSPLQSNGSAKTKTKTTKKKPTYAQSENLSWSTLVTKSNSATTDTSTTIEELNKIREDNSFLAQQNQQLMLANLLANSNKMPLNRHSTSLSYPDEPTLNQQLLSNHKVLTRNNASNNLFLNSNTLLASNSQRYPQNRLANVEGRQVKRRRSIGSSIGPVLVYDSTGNASGYKSPFNSSQRAKSRSQTTIHYDQRRDPFKAIPFSYLNSGYLSDGATNQQIFFDQVEPEYRTNVYQQQTDQQTLDETLCHSLPPDSVHFQQQSNISIHQQPKRWIKFPNKPTFVPPPAEKDLNNNRQVSSQFDPEQNSHQLIDLIQQKHRQQIEQANRTAASLAASTALPPEQLSNQNRRAVWR